MLVHTPSEAPDSYARLTGALAGAAGPELGVERASIWRLRRTTREFVCDDREDAAPIQARPGQLAKLESGVLDEGLRRVLTSATLGPRSSKMGTRVWPLQAGGQLAGVLVASGDRPFPVSGSGSGESFFRLAALTLLTHELVERGSWRPGLMEGLSSEASTLRSELSSTSLLGTLLDDARRIANAPIAYAMTSDQASPEILMRAASGVESSAFRRLHLRIGSGLGGRVAASRRCLSTGDYLNDARFDHDAMVDNAVRGEEIRAIGGVPMIASDRLVGVLYVADRTARDFDDSKLAKLIERVGAAAPAVEVAELYRRDLDRLSAESWDEDSVRIQNRLLRQSRELQGLLNEELLADSGIVGIVEAALKETGRPVVALDSTNKVIASAGKPADDFGVRLLRDGFGPEVGRSPGMREILARSPTEIVRLDSADRRTARLVVPIVAGGESLGSLWFEIGDLDEPRARDLFGQVAQAAALAITRQRSRMEIEARLQHNFLDDLLRIPAAQAGNLVQRARDMGLELGARAKVIVVCPAAKSDGLELALSRHGHLVYSAVHDGNRVIVASSELSAEGVTDASLDRNARVILGSLSNQENDMSGLREIVRNARGLLNALGERMPCGVLDLGQAGVLALLFGERDSETMTTFLDRVLGSLQDRDPENRLDLIGTLEAYLAEAGSPRRTAAALHVHVNTVYYRLEKIKAALGDDLTAPMRSLDLRVACLIWRTFGSGDQIVRP